MQILGILGYVLLCLLAIAWTVEVRRQLACSVGPILTAMFWMGCAITLPLSGAAMLHSWWMLPAGIVFGFLVFIPVLHPLLHLLASLYAAVLRLGINPERMCNAQRHDIARMRGVDVAAMQMEQLLSTGGLFVERPMEIDGYVCLRNAHSPQRVLVPIAVLQEIGEFFKRNCVKRESIVRDGSSLSRRASYHRGKLSLQCRDCGWESQEQVEPLVCPACAAPSKAIEATLSYDKLSVSTRKSRQKGFYIHDELNCEDPIHIYEGDVEDILPWLASGAASCDNATGDDASSSLAVTELRRDRFTDERERCKAQLHRCAKHGATSIPMGLVALAWILLMYAFGSSPSIVAWVVLGVAVLLNVLSFARYNVAWQAAESLGCDPDRLYQEAAEEDRGFSSEKEAA